MSFNDLLKADNIQEFDKLMDQCSGVTCDLDLENEERLTKIAEGVSIDTDVDSYVDQCMKL